MEILNYHDGKRMSQEYKNMIDNITYWAGGTSFLGFLANTAIADHIPPDISAITPYIVFLTSLGTLGLLIYNICIKIMDRHSIKKRSKEIHEIVHGKKHD